MVRAMVLLVMVGHGALTIQAWAELGYQGFFPPFAGVNTTQIFSDLVIASSLLHCAIAVDIRQRGDTLLLNLPFLIGTGLSGSFSPLAYFFWRPALLERALRGTAPDR